jgi:hypothetical protein
MESLDITVNGEPETIEVGDSFRVNTQIHFGQGETADPDSILTVHKISNAVDDVHFHFHPGDDEEKTHIIYQYALENNLELEHMERA